MGRHGLVRWLIAAMAGICVLAPDALAAGTPQSYCVQQGATPPPGAVACPASFDSNHEFNTIGDAMVAVQKDGLPGPDQISGDQVMIEPGTYNESVSLTGQANVKVFGNPAYPTRPVITSSDPADTFTIQSDAPGATVTHLELDNAYVAPSGNPVTYAALRGDPTASASDLVIKAASACVIWSGGGSLADITTSELPNSNPPLPQGCMVLNNTSESLTLQRLTINMPSFTTGIFVQNPTAPVAIDHSDVVALAASADGNAGVSFPAFGAVMIGGPNVTIAHSSIEGGSFGVVSFLGDHNTIANSVLTSLGLPDQNQIGGLLGVKPAAVYGLGGPTQTTPGALTLRNVTAIAAGTGSVGVEAGSGVSVGAEIAAPFNPTVINSIVRGTLSDTSASAPDPAGAGKGVVTISYSNYRHVAGDSSTPGPGIQSANPLFVNGVVDSTQNFHLKAGSPAIDAGAPVPAGDTDLDGHARPDKVGTAPDLGAYESALKPASKPTCSSLSVLTAPSKPVRVRLACSNPGSLANTYAILTAPAHGKLSRLDAAHGTVIYTPKRGFTGSDSFAFRASNAVGVSNRSTVHIVVGAPPVISHVKQTHRRWRLGSAAARFAAATAPVGTTFSFRLNETALVTFAFSQGKRVRGRLSFAGHKGKHRLNFDGVLSRGKSLRAGRYVLTISATSAAGLKSKARKLRFTIVG
jgi:hypothetical protein